MPWKQKSLVVVALLGVGSLESGCMIGPDFKTPTAPTPQNWVEGPTTQISTEAKVPTDWWKTFNDPVLEKLIGMAYQENLSLQAVGLRVLQARAARGIEVGRFFPQVQQINGSYTHTGASENTIGSAPPRYFDNNAIGLDAAWELDVWGKFRRGIESADANLYASVMTYDDAVVTLVADVATTYINLRGLDTRIQLAQKNIDVQQAALDIADVRFRAGGTTELDVQQAKAQLSDTKALIPGLQQSRKLAENQLCILLGLPPQNLSRLLGTEIKPIPTPPDLVAVGIPAELLRRRPDIRRAEASAAAQSALIGVAASDLLPRFQINGSIGYSAENFGSMFNETSLGYQVGPSFRWDVLNYGRIINNVRVQDALFEESLTNYQNTVLAAEQDVSNAITTFVHSSQQAQDLGDSVTASLRSVELSMRQYKAGGADFIRVLNATQFLVQEQDRLVVTQINVANSIVALNRALGGGWEIRQGQEFVPAETIKKMRARTDWGNITNHNYDSKKDFLLFPRPKMDTPPDDNPSMKTYVSSPSEATPATTQAAK